MKIKCSRILILAVLAALILFTLAVSLASYADDHGHIEVTTLDKVAHLLTLDDWLERLEDGWIPLSFLDDEELEND